MYVCFLPKIFEKKYSSDFDVPQDGWGLRRFTLRSSNESLCIKNVTNASVNICATISCCTVSMTVEKKIFA